MNIKKSIARLIPLALFSLSACLPHPSVDPVPLPAEETLAQPPISEAAPARDKQYVNRDFGLSFSFPSDWFGPDEYVSGDTLRVAIGSDVVSPYGTDRADQVVTLPNSYYVVVQYTKNNQNNYWQDAYQKLAAMQDGESLSDARGRIIRLRQLNLGDFNGFEYIATLSDTAQTEPVYNREVVLVNGASDLLTISGSPNNVEIPAGGNWRDLYRAVDGQYQDAFHAILDSIDLN
jgi:hypothetical protein